MKPRVAPGPGWNAGVGGVACGVAGGCQPHRRLTRQMSAKHPPGRDLFEALGTRLPAPPPGLHTAPPPELRFPRLSSGELSTGWWSPHHKGCRQVGLVLVRASRMDKSLGPEQNLGTFCGRGLGDASGSFVNPNMAASTSLNGPSLECH